MTNLKNEDRRFIWGMLSPTVFVFLAGIAFPLAYGMYLSLFYTNTILRQNYFVALGNYQSLLLGPLAAAFYRYYFNTVFFTVFTVSFELVFGLGIALMINKEFKGRGIIRAVVLIPWAMPTIVNAQLWSYMFRGDYFGLANSFLFAINFTTPNNPVLFTTESSYVYVNYIFLLGLVGFFLAGFIFLYNFGKALYNHTTNDFYRSNTFLISGITIILGLIFGILLPMVLGVDKVYGYSGNTLLANNLIPLSFPILLALIFIILFVYVIYKVVMQTRSANQDSSSASSAFYKNSSFISKIILALLLLVFAIIFPVHFGNNIPIDLTAKFPTALFIVCLVDIWKTTPFMALLILASLQVIPQDLYKAASVDGATSFQQFRQITLPLITPGIGTALIFRCIDAFRVYDILAVFGSRNIRSISFYAYIEQNTGHTGTAAAIAVITFLNIIVFTAFFFFLTRRRYDV